MLPAPSQLDPNLDIRSLATNLRAPFSPDTLVELRRRVVARLEFRPCRKEAKDHEKSIRFKRTAAKILADGFVYQGKAAADLTVAFLALCAAAGIEARFVALKDGSRDHCAAEALLPDGWYAFDVAAPWAAPRKGDVSDIRPLESWKLRAKGPDAWSVGLGAA